MGSQAAGLYIHERGVTNGNADGLSCQAMEPRTGVEISMGGCGDVPPQSREQRNCGHVRETSYLYVPASR